MKLKKWADRVYFVFCDCGGYRWDDLPGLDKYGNDRVMCRDCQTPIDEELIRQKEFINRMLQL